MPKIWADTVEEHRASVVEAILDAAEATRAADGLAGMTMSAIALRAGIGRATLYKYFASVDAIVDACHARQVRQQLQHLVTHTESASPTVQALTELIVAQRRSHAHRDRGDAHDLDGDRNEIVAVLARFLERLADNAAIRADLPYDQLAAWIMHTAHAPGSIPDHTVAALVETTLAPERTTHPGSSPSGRRRRR